MAPPSKVHIRSIATEVVIKTLVHISANEAVPIHFHAHLDIGQPECSVTLDIVTRHRKPGIRSCEIRAGGDNPLVTSDLRGIPLTVLTDKAVAAAKVATETMAGLLPNKLPGRRGPQVLIPTSTLQLVADEYRRAFEAGAPPTAAVKIAFGCSRSHAGRLVGRARAAGYLNPTTGGRKAP